MKPLISSLLFLAVYCVARPLPAAEAQPNDAEIKTLLHERIHALGKNIGIVGATIDATQTRIYSEGNTGLSADKPVDGDTVFEIGSVTKVFTSLILADMVQHDGLKLDDPISKFLPPSVKTPTRNGKEITLLDLATHTSGLPRLPGNFRPKDLNNPYADYTADQMYAFLSTYKLPRDIGSQYEYSNFGVGLLGHILALKSGVTYESLVETRICKPLGMNDTSITLSSDMKSRLAVGHDEAGYAVKNWDFQALAGCGALHSTTNDLLKFLAANMGLVKSDLDPAMKFQQIPRRDTGMLATRIALGWHITKYGEDDVIWHNGGTAGYRSYIGFNKQHQRGVVVLVNAAMDIDTLGLRLLGMVKLPHNHVAIALDPKTYDAYVGKYQLAPGFEFTVRRDNAHLMVQLTGQPFFEIFPESETDFFYKVADAQLTFVKDPTGKVTQLILHQNGIDQPAPREK